MQESDSAGMVRRRQVYIVHGYTAAPTDHWFPWLKERLAADGIGVDILPMPDPDNPVPQDWDAFLDERIVRRDADTYLVAHSLGCIGVVRHALQARDARYGGMLLVAGFMAPVPGLPALDGFSADLGPIGELRTRVRRRTVIASRDDASVPYAMTQELAARLDADFVTVERGGHFLGREGFTAFPLVYERLAAMMGLAVGEVR
ncbi:hypothetical protein ASF77_11370 [Massilia sp. Leaf139]|nr:hypothetical protein ASF77_11370 [Massilia sp. Leaf139]